MTRARVLVFAVAVSLYLPTARFGFVQDDRAIVAANPAVHSVRAALRAADEPYWPRPSTGGLWRPLTIVSFALDWAAGRGAPAWIHLGNALWHGLASVLVLIVLARWLAPGAALAAALVFAVHPVHVEAVAGLVGRAELLAACAMLGAIVAVRGRHWVPALVLAGAAMLAKEHGVMVGAAILLYCWLDSDVSRPPVAFWGGLLVVTLVYLAAWRSIGGAAGADVAAPFLGASTTERLALALPAVARAATVLAWPATLSADYGPQVVPVRSGFTASAAAGAAVIVGVAVLTWVGRRPMPAVAWAAGTAALAYLPTSNLVFASGVVLAERNLYVAVLLPAVALGWVVERVRISGRPWASAAILVVAVATLGVRSVGRLPAWQSNRAHLLTLLAQHPESYRAQASAAAVLAGARDTASARSRYERAIALFDRDPEVLGAYALFRLGAGDTAGALDLAGRARTIRPRSRVAVRVAYLVARARGDATGAAALADSAVRWFPQERRYYSHEPQ
jgi:hypothetical protein